LTGGRARRARPTSATSERSERVFRRATGEAQDVVSSKKFNTTYSSARRALLYLVGTSRKPTICSERSEFFAERSEAPHVVSSKKFNTRCCVKSFIYIYLRYL